MTGTVFHAAPVLALFLGSGLLAAEASVPPLYRQIDAGIENRHLECGSPDHLLVIRQDFGLACVTPGSASRLGWPEVGFSDSNDVMVNSTLKVEAGGRVYRMDYAITNGLVGEVGRDAVGSTMLLKINSIKEGRIMIDIPKSFYTWVGPDARSDGVIVILRTGDSVLEVAYGYWDPERGRYLVEFAFPDTDPEFEIPQVVVPADIPSRNNDKGPP